MCEKREWLHCGRHISNFLSDWQGRGGSHQSILGLNICKLVVIISPGFKCGKNEKEIEIGYCCCVGQCVAAQVRRTAVSVKCQVAIDLVMVWCKSACSHGYGCFECFSTGHESVFNAIASRHLQLLRVPPLLVYGHSICLYVLQQRYKHWQGNETERLKSQFHTSDNMLCTKTGNQQWKEVAHRQGFCSLLWVRTEGCI